ncbi:MAG: arginyltransferase [Myxococcota bacterium]|nr:arginyltransferase [Myxococcota bacterium]
MSARERIVYQELEPCPYIEGESSLMPLRWQLWRLTPTEFDRSLAQGDRRVGKMLYRTECPDCKACEPIRVPVRTFKRSKSQRRTWNKCAEVEVEIGRVLFTATRLKMYNRHKHERGLAKNERLMTRESYEGWFSKTCTDTQEFRYKLNGKIIGISVLDFGENDASSVYFFFDPDYSHLSLGTFSALYEIDWMNRNGMRYYYLGLFVESCAHLKYKSRYYPNERLINGQWVRFDSKPKS